MKNKKISSQLKEDAQFINEMQLIKNNLLIEQFKIFCNEHDIILTDDDFEYKGGILFAKKKNIVLNLDKNIKIDTESLTDWNILRESYINCNWNSGYMLSKKNNYMIMVHPYYSLIDQALYASPFINLFWDYKSNDNVFLAIDINRVRINIDEKVSLPLDAWWGAKYNKDIARIERGTGKLKPKPECDSSIYSFDYNWDIRGNIKTFKSEDFKTEDIKIHINGKEYFPARYIHSTYLINEGFLNHLDGAIHFYTKEEYYSRRDEDIIYNPKHTKHIKPKSTKLLVV